MVKSRGKFLVKLDSGLVGPITSRELLAMAIDGTVMPDTKIALTKGEDVELQWLPAKRVKGLFDENGSPLRRPAEKAQDIVSQQTLEIQEQSQSDLESHPPIIIVDTEKSTGPPTPSVAREFDETSQPPSLEINLTSEPDVGHSTNCPHCGEKNPPQASDCHSCGESLVASINDAFDGPPQIDIDTTSHASSGKRPSRDKTNKSLKWILDVRLYLKSDMYIYDNDTYPAVAAGIRLISTLSKFTWVLLCIVSGLIVVGGLIASTTPIFGHLAERSRVSRSNKNLQEDQIAKIKELRDKTDSAALKRRLEESLQKRRHKAIVDDAKIAIRTIEGEWSVPYELKQTPSKNPSIITVLLFPPLIILAAGLIASIVYILNNIQFVLSIAGCEFVVVFCDTEHHVRAN